MLFRSAPQIPSRIQCRRPLPSSPPPHPLLVNLSVSEPRHRRSSSFHWHSSHLTYLPAPSTPSQMRPHGGGERLLPWRRPMRAPQAPPPSIPASDLATPSPLLLQVPLLPFTLPASLSYSLSLSHCRSYRPPGACARQEGGRREVSRAAALYLDIKEALARMPMEVVDAHIQSLMSAMDLSMKHQYLPDGSQVRPFLPRCMWTDLTRFACVLFVQCECLVLW